MSDNDFTKKYLQDFSSLVRPNKDIMEKIIEAKNIIVNANKNNRKVIS